MEKELYERFGEFGLGNDKDKDLPQIGAVHLAAGYLLSETFEMIGENAYRSKKILKISAIIKIH